MNNLSAPNQARIPIGTVVVNGQKLEVTINLEWARFFESLTLSTNSNTASAISGKNGTDGVAVMTGGDSGESVEFIPGPPGGVGRQGDAGLALFLLQDSDAASGETFLVSPPVVTEPFVTPPLTNGWVNFGGGFSVAGYYKDPAGVVHLRGLVANGTGLPILTLPAGYRPSATSLFSVAANNAFGRVDVGANGDVSLSFGANNYVSLEGITFRAA